MSIAIHKTLSRLQLRIWSALLLLVATQAAWAGVTVSWTAPANGTVYVTAPANIVLQASASATQGYTVSKVEFFNGSTLIGTDTTSPYSFNWNSVPPGTYVLTAKATAVKNSSPVQTATSAAVAITVNAPPVVSMTSPANNSTDLNIPPPIVTLQAQASDPDGTIATVEFRSMNCNGIEASLATLSAAPYTFDWTIPTPYYYSGDKPQCYFVKAVATDNRGAQTQSGWKSFFLNINVQLTSPANGATYAAPASIPLQISVAPSDYPTSKVRYYNGTTLIGESLTAPYSFTWENVAPGTYTLTASLISASGHSFPSGEVNVTVTPAVAQLYFIEVDHLDTPRLIADSTGSTVWRNDNTESFGDSVADENPSGLGEFQFDLGFMGQRRDRETGLWYNGQRDAYNAAIGRYTQPEPLGVEGDINLYRYARSNPLSLVDPDGRQAQAAGAACGPYALVCVVGITAVYYATVTGIKAKSGAANDACYDDPCERRQKILLKWYTNLLASMAGNHHVGWGLVLIREAHRYNKTAAVHNSVCPKAQVPYIGVSPYLDVIPGGQPPDLSEFYLRGP